MFEVGVARTFHALHQLEAETESASHEHSHDYRVEAVARGDRLDENGMLLDLDLLGAALTECLAELDAADLDALPAFAGTVAVASWYGTREVTLGLGGAFHRRRLRVISSQVSTLDPVLAPRWDRDRRTALVSSLLAELPLRAMVTHRFPFHEAAAAYELLDRSPEEVVQVVLDYV